MSKFVHFLMRSNRAFYGLVAIIAMILTCIVAIFHVKVLPKTPELYGLISEYVRGEECAYGIMISSDYVNDVFLHHIESLESFHPASANNDSVISALCGLETLPGVRHAYGLQFDLSLLSCDGAAPKTLADSLAAKRELFKRLHLGGIYSSPKFINYTLNRVRFTNILLEGDTLRMILCAFDRSGNRMISLPKSDSTLSNIHWLVALEMDPQWIRQAVAKQMEKVFYEREGYMLWSPGIPENYGYSTGLGVLAFGDTLWWKGLKSVTSGKVCDWNWPKHPWFSYRSLQEDDADQLAQTEKEIAAHQATVLFADISTLAISVLLIATLILVRKQWLVRQAALTHLAHAVRSPVARLRLDVDSLLQGRAVSADRERDLLAAVGNECERLERAVQNAALCLENGARRINRRPDDLHQIVIKALRPWHSVFQSAGIELRTALPVSPITGLFDSELLTTLLDNLLDNALRHTRIAKKDRADADCFVLVSLETSAGRARLAVDDGGDGVPAADRRRIFRRYERGSNVAATGTSGLGLGLTLAQEIAEGHRGTIAVEDNARGGATFAVTLPLDV